MHLDTEQHKMWMDVLVPALKALSEDVQALHAQVAPYGYLTRRSNRTWVWPRQSNLQGRFREILSEELAWASLVFYYHGYWHPRAPARVRPSYAHFSNYADQVIRSRLPLHVHWEQQGFGFEVRNGLLWLCLSTPHFWERQAVCLATFENLQQSQELLRSIASELLPLYQEPTWDGLIARYDDTVSLVQDTLWPKTGSLSKLNDDFFR